MNRLTLLFFYTTILLLFFHPLPIFFFPPFLMIAIYKKPLLSCLWLALLSGLFIDLLSAHSRFGLYALNYCLTVAVLYKLRLYFFEDSFTTIPILTGCFSILSTLIQTALLYTFGQKFLFSWEWVKSDLFWLPLADAAYATLGFTLPGLFIPKSPVKQTRVISLKDVSYE